MRCGALSVQRAKLQAVEARESRGLFKGAAKTTLVQQDGVCRCCLQRVSEVEIREHITAEWLLPCPCAGKVGEDEVDKVRGVLGYRVAIDCVGIVWVPT